MSEPLSLLREAPPIVDVERLSPAGPARLFRPPEHVLTEIAALWEAGVSRCRLWGEGLLDDHPDAWGLWRALRQFNHRRHPPMLFTAALTDRGPGDPLLLRVAAEAGLSHLTFHLPAPVGHLIPCGKEGPRWPEGLLEDVRRAQGLGIPVTVNAPVRLGLDAAPRIEAHLSALRGICAAELTPIPLAPGRAPSERGIDAAAVAGLLANQEAASAPLPPSLARLRAFFDAWEAGRPPDLRLPPSPEGALTQAAALLTGALNLPPAAWGALLTTLWRAARSGHPRALAIAAGGLGPQADRRGGR